MRDTLSNPYADTAGDHQLVITRVLGAGANCAQAWTRRRRPATVAPPPTSSSSEPTPSNCSDGAPVLARPSTATGDVTVTVILATEDPFAVVIA